jgi:hypothetical protein
MGKLALAPSSVGSFAFEGECSAVSEAVVEFVVAATDSTTFYNELDLECSNNNKTQSEQNVIFCFS